MSNKLDLIQQIVDGNKNPKPKSNPSGIRYQQYEISVEGKATTVNIPVRESANFETFFMEMNKEDIEKPELKKILREFRGTRSG